MGNDRYDTNQTLDMQEKVNRIFTKMHRNAIRQKKNFEGTEYDLDRQINRFMKERNKRLSEMYLKHNQANAE